MLSPEIYTNDILIEEAPSGKTSCKKCHGSIPKAAIRLTFRRFWSKSHYFHLHCFTPILQVRVYSEANVNQVTDPEKRQEVEEWIEAWNQQFTLSMEWMQVYMHKQVTSAQPHNRRALLECFKYLDVRTLVRVGEACKAWYHVSWEAEIWDVHVLAVLGEGVQQGSGRSAYVFAYFSLCLHCKKPLQNSERHMICPLTKRPKCLACFANRNYRPLTLDWVKRDRLSVKTLKELQVPIFNFHNRQCVYLYMLEGKLGLYRKQRALQLVENWKPEWTSVMPQALCEFLQSLEADCYEHNEKALLQCPLSLHSCLLQVLQFVNENKPIKTFKEEVAKLQP